MMQNKYQKPSKSLKPEIVFEDNSVVIVNKPSGWLVIPDHWDSERANLKSWLQTQMPDNQIFVVHRIDAETSGITIFAKTSAAHKELSRQFENHQVKKAYLTLVAGVIPESSGTIDKPIGAHPSKKGRVIIARDGKPSVTRWAVEELFRNMTLVKAMPETGRTHQIRIHFQSIGHPLAVDRFYGTSDALYLSQFKRGYRPKAEREEKPLIDRLTLHASEITFTHPDTGEVAHFECGLPKDMRVLLKQLRKYAAPAGLQY